MRLLIASDHAGFELKKALAEHLVRGGHQVHDLGPVTADRCDYPDYAAAVARGVARGDADLGVLVCGSGIGMSIAANKVPGVRAALAVDVEHALLARQHNDANVVCLGSRIVAVPRAESIVDAFIGAAFEGGRHAGRVQKIHALEEAPAGAG